MASVERGVTETHRQIEQLTADTLDRLCDRLREVDCQYAAQLEEIRADASRLALAIAAKLAPALIRQQPLTEAMDMIADCLTRMPLEPRVVIRISEALVGALQDQIDDIAKRSGFSGTLVLLGEPTLDGADCRVEWADGGAERDIRGLQETLQAEIERYCRARTVSAKEIRAAEPTGEDPFVAGP